MNIRSGSMHPATIGEALTHVSKIINSKGDTYSHIDRESSTLPLFRRKRAETSFLALGDVCMTQAPSMGRDAAPSALESFGSDIVLHFGCRAFGCVPRPPVLVAQDLETSFKIYQRACRSHGTDQIYRFIYKDDEISAIGKDLPDAILRHLTLTGALTDAPYFFTDKDRLSVDLTDLDYDARRSLKTRLDRAVCTIRKTIPPKAS